MSASSVSDLFGFGFYCGPQSIDLITVRESADSYSAVPINLANGIGYVPLLSIFTVIWRILAIKNDPETSVAFKVVLGVRASLELIGCGLLFLIPDLIATICRDEKCCCGTL